MKRIPITMCHGITNGGGKPLTVEHFDGLMEIAAELGFQSVNYNDLDAWRAGDAELPEHPIMIDFDHPVKSMRYEGHDVLSRYGFKGNLFINTGPMQPGYEGPPGGCTPVMTWDEVAELVQLGWHIGAHTVNHPNLSELSIEDPTGEKIRAELEQCDATIEENLGIVPKDFAFTGISFSHTAQAEVKKRYRFGRLWITQSNYHVDGNVIRYAELVGVDAPDEPDGGPPSAARYITRDVDPYLLPSMELQALVYAPDAFRAYLEGAL